MNTLESKLVELLPRLRRYARSLTRDRFEADDLLQDCVQNAIESQGYWRGANLAGWTMAIMTNLNRNRQRRQQRSGMFSSLDEVAEPVSSTEPADPLERDRLRAAIDALSPDHRAVLMLVVVEGYSYSEVAGMLGVPLGTVMSRLSRARRGVAATLRGHNIIDMRRP